MPEIFIFISTNAIYITLMAFLLASIKFIANTKWRRVERKKLPGLIYTNQLKSYVTSQTFVGSLAIFNISNQGAIPQNSQSMRLLKEKIGQAVIDSTLLLTGLLKA